MNFDEKIRQLSKLIESKLLPLITNDYVLYDLPYYANIGDTLIWQGELDFLTKVPFRCLDYASRLTCRFPDLPPEVIILFQGGGNMGDMYHEHMEFLIKLARTYKNNKIVVFPQTFYYDDDDVLKADMEALSAHCQLMICARDQVSYQLVQRHFPRQTLLVPDMAFSIDRSKLEKLCLPPTKGRLYIRRTDVELKKGVEPLNVGEMESRDWPTFYRCLRDDLWVAKIINFLSNRKLPFIGKEIDKVWNWYAATVYKNKLIRIGVRFISPFQEIHTTRLHGCILAVLLHKPVTMLDNSYRKNSNFYSTWLENVEQVNFLS